MKSLIGILFLLLLLYPIWGGVCLLWICQKLAGKGTVLQRIVWALLIAVTSTAIFTPVMFGTEGFGFFAPWIIVFFDSQHSIFWWPLSAFVFVVAFTINMASGEQTSD